MYARVILKEGAEHLLTVPESALVRRGQLTGIFTVSNADELVLRWIRTGKSEGGEVEVLAGLSAGETYVVSADPRLKEGRKVTVRWEVEAGKL